MKVRRAYTLIELLVTVGIIMILMGTSIPAYLKFNSSQTVDSDARSLVTEFNRVRSLAANQVYPTGCISLVAYNIKSVLIGSDPGQSGVSVTPVCIPTVSGGTPTRILTSSFVTVPFDVTFSAGNGYLSSGADLDVTIKNNDDDTITKVITLGAYGSAYLK